MKNCKWLAGALTAALLLAGCGQTPTVLPTPTPTVTPSAAPVAKRIFALPYSPTGGFHPITGTERINLTLAPLLYRGLFKIDGRFEAQKDLCLDYAVSEDGLTWTFTLVEETFSDGSPLTPSEVASSLNLARRNGRFSARLANLKKIAAQGETVVVTLSEPNGGLPALLDVPVVKETGDPALPLGAGSYYLASGEGAGKNEWTLVAREGAGVPVGPIPLRPVAAGDDLIAAFDAGEVSVVDTDLTGSNPLGYSGRFETTDYPTTTLLYVGMNTARTSVCQDAAVRQAVALSIDRTDMVDRLLAGHAVAAEDLYHPRWFRADGIAQAAPDGVETGLSPAGSGAELLAGAGWTVDDEGVLKKGRTKLSLRLIVNQDNSYKAALAEALAAELEGLGCEVTLDKLPWEDFTAALTRGEFDLYLGETTMTADFDPAPLVETGGALNYGKFSDKEMDALLEERRFAGDGDALTGALGRLYAALRQAAPVTPICFKNGSVLTQWGQVSGLEPVQRDIFNRFETWRIEG